MEDAGALGKVQVMVGGQTALVPFAVLPMGLVAVVGLVVAEVEAAPVKIFFSTVIVMLLRETCK